jgi:hypothetical protein
MTFSECFAFTHAPTLERSALIEVTNLIGGTGAKTVVVAPCSCRLTR